MYMLYCTPLRHKSMTTVENQSIIDFFQTETGAIGVQLDLEFLSEHLGATGDIMCSFAPDGKVTDVIAPFER